MIQELLFLNICDKFKNDKHSILKEKIMSEIVTNGGRTVVRPGIDIVASMAEDFKGELLSAINEYTGDFVIDLEGVRMVDSIGIGVIIATHNTLSHAGRNLKIINVSKDVYGLFSTMRLNRRFTIMGEA